MAPGLELAYAAFMELDTCRVFGGPIPWTAIRAYAESMGVDDVARLTRHVRALDRTYLDHREREHKRTMS